MTSPDAPRSSLRSRLEGAWSGDRPGAGAALDMILVAIAGFIALANLTTDFVPDGARELDPGGAILAAVMVLVLLLRRISPVAVLFVSTTAWMVLSLAPYPPVLPVVPIVAVLFLATEAGGDARGRNWPELVGAVGGLALLAPVFLVDTPPREEAEFHVAYLLLAALAWIAGERIGQRRIRAQAQEQAAVAAERERLSREIHDSVGHTISAIGVSAGAARLNLRSDPAVVAEAIEQIESTAHRAAAELDSLLGDLDGTLPDAGDIPALIAERRAQGQSIEANVDPLDSIEPAVSRVLFRIAQESLTNASRHAPKARVELSITEEAGHVSLTVSSAADRVDLVAGRGISGMVARAHEVGGELTVTAEESSVVVSACLPSGGGS